MQDRPIVNRFEDVHGDKVQLNTGYIPGDDYVTERVEEAGPNGPFKNEDARLELSRCEKSRDNLRT